MPAFTLIGAIIKVLATSMVRLPAPEGEPSLVISVTLALMGVVEMVVSPEPAKVRPKAPLTPPVTVSFPLEEPTYAALARVIGPL